MTDTKPVAGEAVAPEILSEWVETFHREGFLFLPSLLPPEWVSELATDLDRDLANSEELEGKKETHLIHRMFERSDANLRLFDMEPIVSFAEALIAANCHVIHNNSFVTPTGAGLQRWHQDDPPHYLVTHGEAPTNVRLPVLVFTANYYLTDVTEVENGSTETIPRSHLYGQPCPDSLEDTEWEHLCCPNLGPAGSVIMFNNQVWHRGGPNLSERTRKITQVTYGRRLVGHKFYPFMNYQMPEHLFQDTDERRRRLLGFLEHGAYG